MIIEALNNLKSNNFKRKNQHLMSLMNEKQIISDKLISHSKEKTRKKYVSIGK